MQISEQGKGQIASYEGLCLKPYYDSVHVLTLGFGSTVTDIPDIHRLPMDKAISVEQAINYFNLSLPFYERAVNEAIKVTIKQYQFDALVSIAYNIGVASYLGEGGYHTNTFVKRINAGDSNRNIGDAIMMFDKPSAIIQRREKESLLYRTGNYVNRTIMIVDTDNEGHQLMHTAKDVPISLYFKL